MGIFLAFIGGSLALMRLSLLFCICVSLDVVNVFATFFGYKNSILYEFIIMDMVLKFRISLNNSCFEILLAYFILFFYIFVHEQ